MQRRVHQERVVPFDRCAGSGKVFPLRRLLRSLLRFYLEIPSVRLQVGCLPKGLRLLDLGIAQYPSRGLVGGGKYGHL